MKRLSMPFPARLPLHLLPVLLLLAARALCQPAPTAADRPGTATAELSAWTPKPLPEALRDRLRQFSAIRSARPMAWMPDGQGLAVRTNLGAGNQVYHVREPLGLRRQLTFSSAPVLSAAFPPGESAKHVLLTTLDTPPRAYLLDLSRGRRGAPLATGDGLSSLWLPGADKPTLALTRPAPDQPNQGELVVWSMDQGSTPAQVLLMAPGRWTLLDVTRDGSKLLAHRDIPDGGPLVVVDRANGALRPITEPSTPDGRTACAAFDATGAGVFHVAPQLPPNQRLRYTNLEFGVSKALLESTAWNPTLLAASPDAKHIALVNQEEGLSKLFLLDTTSLALRPLAIPEGKVTAVLFHPSGDRLAFGLETAASPEDVYTIALQEGTEAVRWTESEVGGLPPDLFLPASRASFPTPAEQASDAATPRRVPVTVLRPQGQDPVALLVQLPSVAQRVRRGGFDPFSQFLASELSFAVLHPQLDGDDAAMLRDLQALLDWAQHQPELEGLPVFLLGEGEGAALALQARTSLAPRLAGVAAILPKPADASAAGTDAPLALVVRERGWKAPDPSQASPGGVWTLAEGYLTEPQGEESLRRRERDEAVARFLLGALERHQGAAPGNTP